MSLTNFKLYWVMGGALLVLLIGTLIRLLFSFLGNRSVTREQIASLISWWVLISLIFGAAFLGITMVAIILMLFSIIGLTEYLRFAPKMQPEPLLRWLVYLFIPLGYGLILSGSVEVFQIGLPFAWLFIICTFLIIKGNTSDYLRRLGYYWLGLAFNLFLLGHAVLLMTLPLNSHPADWFIYLILLTEVNDIMQALIGKQFGRHLISPNVSPHKTWEGWLGGFVSTVLLALLLGTWLTPWDPWLNVLAGGLIAIFGFFGDLNISAMKRDANLQVSGRLVPGQGGLLDRIDSLIFTAPLFYYFVQLVLRLESTNG